MVQPDGGAVGLRDTEPAGALSGKDLSNLLEEEQELASDTERQCSPGCRGTRWFSFQQPKPGSVIYKGIFLILGRSTVRCTERAFPTL